MGSVSYGLGADFATFLKFLDLLKTDFFALFKSEIAV